MISTKDKPPTQYHLSSGTARPAAAWKWIFRLGPVLLLLCGIAVAQGAGVFKQKTAVLPAAATAVPVLTVTVQPASIQSINRTITVNGTISAWDPISVGAESSGLQISSILVDEGATVKRGQILATLDSSLIKPQLESEEARLKASLASAKKALQPNRPEDINALNAAVSQAQATIEDQEAALVQAQANLMNANQNLQRYELLQKDGAVSLQEMENRETTAKVANANVRSAEKKINAAKFSLQQAQERLSMAKIGGRNEDIQIADANTAEIRGNIKRLQAQIAQTLIKAPVDGVIVKRDAHVGDIVAAGKVMFSMARDSRLELRAQVPETDLAAFKPGEHVKIMSALSAKDGIKGRLREISPLVDSDTRLATVRIDIPISAAMKPGMYAEGNIDVGKSAVLTVPAQAVISQDDKSVVFILHKNHAESRIVTVGSRTSDLIEVKAGLQVSDLVIVTGAGFLKDGDCVAVAK